MKKRIIRSINTALLALTMVVSTTFPAKAAVITTPTLEISKKTNLPTYMVEVNGINNQKTSYKVFCQDPKVWGKKNYISIHGCAVCALTTVLSAHSKAYANYTPDKTSKILEKKVFGKSSWRSNYSRSFARQMPISLNGISKVLKYAGIKNRYVRSFKNASAVRQIENHLKKGKPVIIEANNHQQTNGVFSKNYNQKWALTKHTMALIGMTDTGKVIIADSAYRKWSGEKQRVKFAKMSELVRFMIPCTKTQNTNYYKSIDSCGGYILVK